MNLPLAGALSLLERAVGYTRISLQAVASTPLSAPTPCARWDLAALLAHMDDSLAALAEAGRLGQVDIQPPAVGASDLVESIRDRACALLGAWAKRDGADLVRVADHSLSAAILVTVGALEVTVHGWDVSRACRSDHPIPDSLADELLDLVPLLVSPRDRPARFAGALPVTTSDPAETRLLAALGRRHDWRAPTPLAA